MAGPDPASPVPAATLRGDWFTRGWTVSSDGTQATAPDGTRVTASSPAVLRVFIHAAWWDRQVGEVVSSRT
jgi:hypothetical protein